MAENSVSSFFVTQKIFLTSVSSRVSGAAIQFRQLFNVH